MKRLRMLRELRGLSLRKLGGLAGVHYTSLIRLEAGAFDPRLSTLRKLAEALEVTVCELLEEPPPLTKRRKHGTDEAKRRVLR